MKRLVAASALTIATAGLMAAPAGATERSPAALTFPSQAVGSTSAGQTIVVTPGCNTPNPLGGGCLVPELFISQPALTGANFADFAQTTTCSPAPSSSACTFTVTFKPTAPGTRTATLTLGTGAIGPSPGPVTLTGTGAAPPVTTTTPATTPANTPVTAKKKCKKKGKKAGAAAKKCRKKK